MIGIEQYPRPARRVCTAPCPNWLRRREIAGFQHCRMGDRAERNQHARMRTLLELRAEVSIAGFDLRRQWLIVGRQALDGIC